MPGQLKLYTDSHIAKAVTTQLRKRGVDIVRCQEVGMADIDDDAIHLEYATNEGRAILTCDQDFLVLHHHWHSQGKHHAGIIFVPSEYQNNVGMMVKELFMLYALIEGGAGNLENDVYDKIYRLG
jgi:predicted nuclease of predicted toxin-antitoxin system